MSSSRRRRLPAPRTLRGRLIAGVLALLVLAGAVVGLTSMLVVQRSLLAKVDDALLAASARAGEHGGPGGRPGGTGPDGGEATPGPGQGPGTLEASIVGATVGATGVVSDTGTVRTLSAADQTRLLDVPVDGQPHSVTLPDTGHYRVVASVAPGGQVLLTGLPLAEVDATLRTQLAVELGVLAALLVVTGLAAAALVRTSLRPLDRVAATARAVSAMPLASGDVALPQRVPDADPDTEVGQVAVAFNRMLEHVDAALRQRQVSEDRLRRFVADASHELRTPVAAIRGHAELARRVPDPLPPEVSHALARVESAAQRMGVLVDDLLLLARLDSGRPLARDPVDLCRLALEVTADARAAAPGHPWRLDLPARPVLVVGDEQRLHQVLGNLLTNARTHTPAGTSVTVRVVAPAADDDTAALEVVDTGPGIPPQIQDRMFERFVRADTSRSRADGGTGLGLAIVDAVVQSHDGRVSVRSGAGGTTVRIELPGARVAPPEPERDEDPDIDGDDRAARGAAPAGRDAPSSAADVDSRRPASR